MTLWEELELIKEQSIEIWPMDKYFAARAREKNKSDIYRDWEEMEFCIEWARENCGIGTWAWSGVTIYSFKFFFTKPEDAVAFKLRFGL